MSSYIKKKMKLLSSKQKSFKEFKPKIEHIDETDSMIPQLLKAREKEKELGVINPAFPHLNMEGQIDRLRKKVEKDAKRKKIESDIKKKKKKVNINKLGSRRRFDRIEYYSSAYDRLGIHLSSEARAQGI